MTRKKSIINVLSPKEHSDKEQPDIFNKNGEIRFIYSFQFQLIKSTLLALLLTVLTEALLVFIVFLVSFIAGNTSDTENLYSYEQVYPNQNTTGNSGLNSITKDPDPEESIQDSFSNAFTGLLDNYTKKKEPLEKHFPPAKKLIKKQQLQKLFFLLALIIACSLALFISYFLLLTRHLSSYLAEITSGINEIAKGSFEHQIPVRTRDELGLIAGCINEMSEQIQNNMNLERQTEQEKNQLITSVAHDIRTPLTSILGYLELLCYKSPSLKLPDEKQQEYLRIAYEKSLRLMTLTEDLFTYTKVSFGELKIQIQPLDLIMLLEQMIEEFYPSFMDAGLECRFLHSLNTIALNGDSSLLARAFSNLLSNAVKYGKDGKELSISADILAGSAVIKITNYGTLIPDEALQHIFERFYRVEHSRSLDTGGSGLGLSIAQRIILLHHGTIHAASGHDGTSFIVTLPLDSQA